VKLLLDSCISKAACAYLRDHGHDVDWATEWVADPGDEEILARATKQGRVLVTLDKDFGEIAIRNARLRTGVIRLVGLRAIEQGPAVDAVVAAHADDLAQCSLLTVERDRVRIRQR
jgi:predicted nuclease of predicted toxin-antitoxin system